MAANRSGEKTIAGWTSLFARAGRVLGLLLAKNHKPGGVYAFKQTLLLSISTPLRKLEDQKQDYNHCQKRRDGRHIVVPPC